MHQHGESTKLIRIWGLPRKPGLRDRLLDFTLHIIVLCVLILLISAVQTAMAGEPDDADVHQGSLFYRSSRDGKFHAAPLLHTDVEMRVSGFVNRTHLTQTFSNYSDEWVEGKYVFPLPENSAVDHMRIQIGQRVIEGQIREKSAARRQYRQARRTGKHASLLEQERPNMFTTSVANIAPHESVRVEIEYQQTLRYDQGHFSLRFPLAITPRYIPGTRKTNEASDERISGDNSESSRAVVTDASRITPPVALDQKINPVSLHIELDAGFPVQAITSPYFPIVFTSHGEGRYTINLADKQVPSDRDFELRWTPVSGRAPRAALFRERVGHDMYYLGMILPPGTDHLAAQTLPREVIYVIDTSGSMGGVSIRQARQALLMAIKHLRSTDSFNVIQFNSVTDSLFAYPVLATLENRTRALNYVAGLQAGGGTEMMSAMRAALAGSDDTSHLRQVIFLTDGAVGNEDQLFDYIHHHLGNSRLFTLGIGSAPNSHFMRRAAKFGRGTYTYIGRIDEVADKMKALFSKLDSPVMRDLKLQHDFGAFDLSPKHLPDLYRGEPLMFTARSRFGEGELVLSGQRRHQPWQTSLFLQTARPGKGLGKLWARRRIASLIDSVHDGADADDVRKQVIALALQHHLVSKYTSLVAVDTTPARPDNAALHSMDMPVNLPRGQVASKIFALRAQTGTAQNLFWLIGLLFLFLGLGLYVFEKRKQYACHA